MLFITFIIDDLSMSSLADILKELDDAYEKYRRESDSLQRRKLQLSIQRALIRSQELGDEKIQIVGQMVRKEYPAAVAVKLRFGIESLPGLNVYNNRIEQHSCFNHIRSIYLI